MKKLVAFVAVMLIMVMMAPAMAAPLFGDVPASHWAKDAIASLAAKGLIEGYPDGTFKGDRATTRYEMAMIVARLLAKVDQMGANYASKADMETMKTLANDLRDELSAMGVRVASTKDNLQKLDDRVTALEKITFYGSFDTVENTMGFTNGRSPTLLPKGLGTRYISDVGSIPGTQHNFFTGTPGRFPVLDYMSGRTMTNGTGPSTLANLGLKIKVSEGISAGAEFAAYVPAGSFVPDEGTILPTGLLNAQQYYNWAFGMNLDYAFNGGNVKLNFLRVANDQSNGLAMTTGGNMHNPYGWVNFDNYLEQDVQVAADRPINIPGSFGPQGISTVGVSLNYKIPIKWDLRFIGEAAGSNYQSNMGSKHEQSGTAGKASLATSLMGGNLGLQLDYISVDPYYDPFVLAYPIPADGFTVPFMRLPNFAYYPGLYQLHDSYEYPDNRQGIRFKVDYKFGDSGTAFLRYGSLEQYTASAPNAGSNFDNPSGFRPGFMEPVFSPLYGGETTKGQVQNWGLGLSYKIPTYKLKINVGYDDYTYKRDSSINYTNMRAAQGRIGLAYLLSEKFTLKGGYNFANVSAKAKNANAEYGLMDSSQTIPYLGFDYSISQNTNWGLTLKTFNTTDSTNESDLQGVKQFQWSGSQILTELKVSF